MGSRLKNAKARFTYTAVAKMLNTIPPENLAAIDMAIANSKLDKGPATDIRAESLFGLDSREGSNGTGLPQPNPKNSSAKVPIGSKCFLGSKLTLP